MLPVEDIYPRYGMPNDFLVTLNLYNMRVMDVPVEPVYGIGEVSGFKAGAMIPQLSRLLARLFVRRMVQKYIVRDFHPLIFFYAMGFTLLTLAMPLAGRMFFYWGVNGFVPHTTALALMFCTVLGFQSVLFAMLFDMESNRELIGR